jgi:hypothetical protein
MILQSDNGAEFIAEIIWKVMELWPSPRSFMDEQETLNRRAQLKELTKMWK